METKEGQTFYTSLLEMKGDRLTDRRERFIEKRDGRLDPLRGKFPTGKSVDGGSNSFRHGESRWILQR